jgi:hypothetical protein
MPRYFFDFRDGDHSTTDDDGINLAGLDAARDEAARALAEMARDVLPGSARRVLVAEVKDEAKQPLLEARLVFEVARLRSPRA